MDSGSTQSAEVERLRKEHPEARMPGVGTGCNPATQRYAQCRVCRAFLTDTGYCSRCGEVTGPAEPIPEDPNEPRKRCSLCRKEKGVSQFREYPANNRHAKKGARYPRCRQCEASVAAERRKHKRILKAQERKGIPGEWAHAQPAGRFLSVLDEVSIRTGRCTSIVLEITSPEELSALATALGPSSGGMAVGTEAKVWRLLKAAQAALAAGSWHGREGLRAYRELFGAMEAWKAPKPEEDEEPIWIEEAD